MGAAAGSRLDQMPAAPELELVDDVVAQELMAFCSVQPDDAEAMLAARPEPGRENQLVAWLQGSRDRWREPAAADRRACDGATAQDEGYAASLEAGLGQRELPLDDGRIPAAERSGKVVTKPVRPVQTQRVRRDSISQHLIEAAGGG